MSAGNEREFIDFQQSKEKGGRPMNCPKYVAAAISYQGNTADIDVICDKEECAWWDRTDDKCVILQLAFELDKVQDRLERIWDKMPHIEEV